MDKWLENFGGCMILILLFVCTVGVLCGGVVVVWSFFEWLGS